MTLETTSEKYIYKYFPVNEFTIRTLINNELFFSNPIDFNDPFDCQFILNLVEGSEAEKELIDKMQLSDEERNLFESKGLRSQLSSGLTPRFRTELAKLIGVTCFTEKPNDFLMWSHYAKSHTGICLKFDWKIHEDYFQGTKVIYDNSLPIIEYSSSQGFQNQIPKIVSTKLSHWSHENEIRSAVEIKSDNRCISFNPAALTGIIFGDQASEKDIDLIKRIVDLHDGYEKLSFERATLSREQSKIIINAL